MCGIAGFIGNIERKEFIKLVSLMSHRGPDDDGYYFYKNISLGHRRLSIIDLSKTGHQPMENGDGSLVITFNGEIYNYQELKRQLLTLGHTFKSTSDTEVLLHLFEEYGYQAINKLDGIFAFAIFNKKNQELFLCRDHLGIKPLYYYRDKDFFIFSSSIKPISNYHKFRKEINYEALNNYLTLRYNCNEETILKGIYKLTPGSYLVIRNDRLIFKKYWQPSLREDNYSEQEATNKGFDLLKKSVVSQMISDVPVGCYLSGGLDSSLIVALMREIRTKRIDTFSISFHAPIDETENAEYVSDYFKTVHHVRQLKKSDLLKLPEIINYLDEPFADPIILPQFVLAEFTSKKVKVTLTGEGADELFGGYIHHLTLPYIYSYQKNFPKILQKSFLKLLDVTPTKLLSYFFPYPSSLGNEEKMKIINLLKTTNNAELFLATASLFSKEQKNLLFTKDLKNNLYQFNGSLENEIKQRLVSSKNQPFLNQLVGNDLLTWLPNYILYQSDRMSMANSLEARVPYLNKELVEFVNTLPINLKIKGLTTKYLLRKIAKKILPKEIYQRKKKSFYFPIEYYQGKELNELINLTINKKQLTRRGFFNCSYIDDLVKNMPKNPLLLGKQLFSLISLELWCQDNLD